MISWSESELFRLPTEIRGRLHVERIGCTGELPSYSFIIQCKQRKCDLYDKVALRIYYDSLVLSAVGKFGSFSKLTNVLRTRVTVHLTRGISRKRWRSECMVCALE